jgi:hypothetical protein
VRINLVSSAPSSFRRDCKWYQESVSQGRIYWLDMFNRLFSNLQQSEHYLAVDFFSSAGFGSRVKLPAKTDRRRKGLFGSAQQIIAHSIAAQRLLAK